MKLSGITVLMIMGADGAGTSFRQKRLDQWGLQKEAT
jgi:hypothetical protein